MITVKRGNVRLKVQDEDKQYYKDCGYDILDENGKVVEKAIPRDVGRLTGLYLEVLAENGRYKKQVEDLKKEIKKLKSADKAKKSD